MTLIAEPVKPTSSERVRFKNSSHPFFPELKKRIRAYFDNKKLDKTGDAKLYIKSLQFLGLFLGCYAIPLVNHLTLLPLLCLYAIMGFSAAAIGFNLMHDGAHGSYSNKKWLNNWAAYSINLLGGDANLWKNKHNIIHHTYTNIEGYDQDIAQMPVFRLNRMQKKSSFHRFQHIYCFLVYGLSSILWIFLLDYIKYFTGKVGNIKLPRFTLSDHLIFWTTKIAYLFIYIAVPVYFIGWVYTICGFLVYHFALGLTLSVVFQLAHVVEPTEFSEVQSSGGKINEDWALHQLKTTANFATDNSFITWYTGGLNFQIEHHLFPTISHTHYPALSKIVKQLCMEMDITYHEFPSFSDALNSHLSHLKETGIA